MLLPEGTVDLRAPLAIQTSVGAASASSLDGTTAKEGEEMAGTLMDAVERRDPVVLSRWWETRIGPSRRKTERCESLVRARRRTRWFALGARGESARLREWG